MTPELVLPFAGEEPAFAARPIWCGLGSTVIGRTGIGVQAWLGDDTVIRGDGHDIVIGDRFWLGARSTLHIAHDVYPCIVGDRVTVGRNAVVHACTIGDDGVIEDDCVILDGSVVEDGVLIEAGSTVYPRTTLPGGFAYAGSPVRPVRPLAPGELAERAERLREAAAQDLPRPPGDALALEPSVFVARTARLHGRIALEPGSGVFFGCDLAAEVGPIVVGAGSNVQDNTVIRTRGSGLVIEREVTIGHNVHLGDGRIGARSLIGMGAVLAPDTIVGPDVLVAAGTATDPGQELESGWLWGGRPARRIGRLDGERRAMMQRTIEQYGAYGRTYRKAQDGLG